MCNIVNGCVDASQVVDKKAELFRLLSERNITIDSQERYYDKEINWDFLINNKSFYEYKDTDISEKDIDRKVNLLNYISIKRGYKSQSIFRTVGHILLSANKITFNIAFNPNVREPNSVPLATSLSFLTNRFWMVLNKGLSNISTLRSINVITKAQIALSSRINDNVGRLFSQFVEEDKQGKFDTEKKKAMLAELHKSVICPDDLNADNADAYVDVLNVNDINAFIAEKELLEAKKMRERHDTLLKMEELKKNYDIALKERDRQVSDQEAILRKAASEILSNRNKKEREQYSEQEHNYITELNSYKKNAKKSDWSRSVKITISYSFVVIALFFCNYFINKENACTFFRALAFISALITYLIPFVRPLWKHEMISNAYKYLLCSSYRKKLNNQHEKYYKENHVKPELVLTSIEDILEELKNIN